MPTTSAALTVAGIDVATAPSLLQNLSHGHGLLSEVGYVVRQTQKAGVWLWHQPTGADGINRGPCGQDVAASESYGRALDVMHALRLMEGSYAVIDRVYACGCRS